MIECVPLNVAARCVHVPTATTTSSVSVASTNASVLPYAEGSCSMNRMARPASSPRYTPWYPGVVEVEAHSGQDPGLAGAWKMGWRPATSDGLTQASKVNRLPSVPPPRQALERNALAVVAEEVGGETREKRPAMPSKRGARVRAPCSRATSAGASARPSTHRSSSAPRNEPPPSTATGAAAAAAAVGAAAAVTVPARSDATNSSTPVLAPRRIAHTNCHAWGARAPGPSAPPPVVVASATLPAKVSAPVPAVTASALMVPTAVTTAVAVVRSLYTAPPATRAVSAADAAGLIHAHSVHAEALPSPASKDTAPGPVRFTARPGSPLRSST
mmetsp:Transcript_11168/g.27265  ORF Transcript_11168/g.27265 Transcript_11168/m.27265 type:complete len:330 (-) Transcript_11168:1522-2511(-)